MICRALGGRVGKARTGGWDIGIREVTMAPTLPPCGFLHGLPPYAKITECHQDEVSFSFSLCSLLICTAQTMSKGT